MSNKSKGRLNSHTVHWDFVSFCKYLETAVAVLELLYYLYKVQMAMQMYVIVRVADRHVMNV